MRKLLLFCGGGWSASSPLIYTLQRKSKYAHFGLQKNFIYLKYPTTDIAGELVFDFDQSIRNIIQKYIEGTWENYKSFEPSSHRMNLPEDLEPLKDFSNDFFTNLITGESKISKFIDFYVALHDHVVSKGYKSVGLFTGGSGYKLLYKGGELEEYATHEIEKALLSEFEIKCLFIVRDPIRRAFGQYLSAMQREIDKRHTDRRFNQYQLPYKLNVVNYLDDVEKCRQVYGEDNVYVTVMEELWEGDGAQGLSEFLGHSIDDLWKNLYAPDRGHLVEYDKDVPCQAYGQDLYELKSDMYHELLTKYHHVYDSWKDMYGSLPMHWGKPIKYEKD